VEHHAGSEPWISRTRFRELVRQALDGVPPEIQDSIRNVEVVVEDWPSAEVLASLDLPAEDTTLFGLYEGVPQPERGDHLPLLPDRIVLYYGSLTKVYRDEYHLRREVRRTVIHEFGHHFGFDDRHLRGRGY